MLSQCWEMTKNTNIFLCLWPFCPRFRVNSLWSSDAIWRHETGSTLAQVMACCLAAPSHYLNQCWLITAVRSSDIHPRATSHLNTLRPRQNGRRFPDDIFKCIFLNENVGISIKFSLKFVPRGPINNIPALVQIMAWRRSGDKPLSEPTMVSLLTDICHSMS